MLSVHTQIGSVLQFGARGGNVKELQQELAQLGYQLRVDGIFGNETRKKVIAFQRDNGIREDGIVGDETKGSIGRALQQKEKQKQPLQDWRMPATIFAILIIGYLWWQS